MSSNASAKVTEMPKSKSASSGTVVKLSEPLETFDGPVTELTLKEPKAGLILKYGQPYRTIIEQSETSDGQRFEIQYVPQKMLMYIEAMSGIDATTLEDLPASDMNALFTAVLSMLQPAGN